MELNTKIILALERISEAYKSLLWEQAKKKGISPIQIQLLIFIANHKSDLCSVSHLAKEFNVTKPTISDVVKVLHNKKIVEKNFAQVDSRSYTLFLTDFGKEVVADIINFSQPIATELKTIEITDQKQLFSILSQFIYKLNVSGVLEVQRTCFGCTFYQKNDKDEHYCNLIQTKLKSDDIRIDCPEYIQR